jgi:hypothetical protein
MFYVIRILSSAIIIGLFVEIYSMHFDLLLLLYLSYIIIGLVVLFYAVSCVIAVVFFVDTSFNIVRATSMLYLPDY